MSPRLHRPSDRWFVPLCALIVAWPGVVLGQKGGAAPQAAAPAAPPPTRVEVELKAGAPTRLQVVPAEGHVLLQVGKRKVAELPIEHVETATARSVALAGGNRVGIVEVEGGGQHAAAVLAAAPGGGARELWSGALDLRGDPGERHGYRIEVGDRTGDGIDDVVVGLVHQRTGVCGQKETLLSPRAVDPKRLKLAPVVLDRVATDPAAPEVQATAQSPGPTGRPLLAGAFRLRSVSSQPGGEPPWLATPPQALTDGNPATAWLEGRGGGGRGEFATFRHDAKAHPLRALAFTLPADSTTAGVNVSRPRALLLVGDDGAQLRVRVDPAIPPGTRQWVTPPAPLAWRCVSVVIAEPGSTGPRDYTGLADVEAYTDLDFGEGVESLVAELSSTPSNGADPAATLIAVGPRALPALEAALPKLPTPGRRRAVRVLASMARSEPGARETLAHLAGDPDEKVADAAMDALLEAGDDGAAQLVPRIATPGARGDRVALALARRLPAAARPAILSALAAEGGDARAELRRALAIACEGGGAALEEVERWSAEPQTPRLARAAAAQALAATPLASGGREVALRLVAAAAPQAGEFVERWRLVEAARSLGPSEPVDAWLAELAASEERWMLRATALTALVERHSTLAKPTARRALDDPYPRVRVVAVEALAGEPGAFERLDKHARRDLWPMVRAAALQAVAGDKRAEPVLRAGAGDRSAKVRAAALKAMTSAKLSTAWPVVKERLADEGELPEVVTEGIAFARTLCVHDAGEPLLALVRRGLDPRAWAPDADVAIVALEALATLGGEHAATAVAMAANPAAPAGFRQAAEQAQKQAPTCPKP